MWTADNRPRYNRDKLRYPSDLTDAEWAHIEPLIPPGKPGGGKRRVAIREVINGVMYILSTRLPVARRAWNCIRKHRLLSIHLGAPPASAWVHRIFMCCAASGRT